MHCNSHRSTVVLVRYPVCIVLGVICYSTKTAVNDNYELWTVSKLSAVWQQFVIATIWNFTHLTNSACCCNIQLFALITKFIQHYMKKHKQTLCTSSQKISFNTFSNSLVSFTLYSVLYNFQLIQKMTKLLILFLMYLKNSSSLRKFLLYFIRNSANL